MPGFQQILRDRFAAAISSVAGQEHAQTDPLLRPTAESTKGKFGDFQANVVMGLAKSLGRNPRDLAQAIAAQFHWRGVCSAPPDVAGPGFINLRLSETFIAQQLQLQTAAANLGVGHADPPQTIVVDYSGPNVAKEMHVGHLRSSVIGDAIARVLTYQGHRVIRQNHLGDWGTQFGMLIERLVSESGQAAAATTAHTFSDLDAFYKDAKAKFDADPAFATRSRERVVKLQTGDARTRELWLHLVRASELRFLKIYERLGVLLQEQDFRPESYYNDRLPATVKQLQDAGLARDSEGALCVFPPGFLNPQGEPLPLIIRKSDGGYLYATTDLAALRYRIDELQAHRIVYVTDARQKQHFAMIFKTAELAGWVSNANTKLEHVPFGTVLGEDGKPFKTRSGETVKLVDLLDEAEQRALKVVTGKNPELPEAARKEIAHAVGVGAIKYADLCNERVKDYVFSWDRMLSFDGNTAPYLQNAYVRIRSIFRKAGIASLPAPPQSIVIADPAERALSLKLLQFPLAVAGVGESLEPHRLCIYLYELASSCHSFYEHCPVLAAPDEATKQSRLALCDLAARVLKQGLGLLGIAVVEVM